MTISTRGHSILVPPGISVKPIVEAAIRVGADEVGAFEGAERATANLRLEYSMDAGRYEIASFGIDRGDLPLEVSGALWRTVRVHAIASIAISRALPLWTIPLSVLRQRRTAGTLTGPVDFHPTDESTLLLTAVTYRIAEISSETPALAVAETMGLKQRTATNWIARARAAGHMSITLDQDGARRATLDLGQRLGLEEDSEESTTSGAAHGHD